MKQLDDCWSETWSTANAPYDAALGFAGHPCFPPGRLFRDCTIRQQVRLGITSDRLRLCISNEFSHSVLTLTKVTIAHPLMQKQIAGSVVGSPLIQHESASQVLFSGRPLVDIPPGTTIVSDSISFGATTNSDITVSIYLEHGHQGTIVASHEKAKATGWLARGDHTTAESLPYLSQPTSFERWFYLAGIESIQVRGHSIHGIACLGDSITDQGDRAWAMDRYNGWPDALFQRLQLHPSASHLTVLNLGISGDRLWSGGLGRFERDVVSRTGIKSVIVLMGTNDINFTPDTVDDQNELYTRLVVAYNQIVVKAHARGIRVLASTILPFLRPEHCPSRSVNPTTANGVNSDGPTSNGLIGNGFYAQSEGTHNMPSSCIDSSESSLVSHINYHRERTRLRINEWICTAAPFDYVVDWAALLHEPGNPHILQERYQFNDYVHPSEQGCRAMAEAIDLAVLL